MQIIDGYVGAPNIYADVIGEHNISMYGSGDYVLNVGECLGYELISNNEIRIKDGMFITQGRRGYIKKGTTEVCQIDNGAQTGKRNDLIVIEYAKDLSTQVESHVIRVLKGIPGAEASDPEITTGSIPDGAILHQMPLYRVKIEGLSVAAIEQLFEIGSVAAETVDPMLATESGYAADAKLTGDAITEIYSNLTAADSVPFRFGVDEEGKYGYIVTDEDGADSVIPFKTGDEYRLEIINALPSKFGLTEDSTWPDIIAVLNEYYPETWSILSNLTSSDWTDWREVSGTVHSGSSSFSYTQGYKLDLYAWANVSGDYNHYAKSASFDITGYNSLVAAYSSSEKGAIFFYLQTEDGNVPVVNGTTDISKYTGMANFYMCVSPGYSGSTLYSGRYTVSSLYLKE